MTPMKTILEMEIGNTGCVVKSHEENMSICADYFKKMLPMKTILEMEVGSSGGMDQSHEESMRLTAMRGKLVPPDGLAR